MPSTQEHVEQAGRRTELHSEALGSLCQKSVPTPSWGINLLFVDEKLNDWKRRITGWLKAMSVDPLLSSWMEVLLVWLFSQNSPFKAWLIS
jgi:hypothetical protein